MLNRLINAGYSVAEYPSYYIVAINNNRHYHLSVKHIKELFPDYNCYPHFGKVLIDKKG